MTIMKHCCLGIVLPMGLMAGASRPAQANTGSTQNFHTSVLEFGAKGDGVTDDTDAIQKAWIGGSRTPSRQT